MKSKRGGTSKSRVPAPGGLDPDDAELWQRTARSIVPLRKAKSRVASGQARQDPASTRDAGHAPGHETSARADARPTLPRTPAHAPSSPPQALVLDRRKARRIATGQVDIEARLDLHGLRQADAHRRLRAFLLDAHHRGLRMVLVITGKGSDRERSGNAEFDATRVEDRGVIRRNVPAWLAEPGLSAVVASYAPAHIRHGGSGALYIHLRKRRVR
jgi:DNA-nicking Smr family endonuclease